MRGYLTAILLTVANLLLTAAIPYVAVRQNWLNDTEAFLFAALLMIFLVVNEMLFLANRIHETSKKADGGVSQVLSITEELNKRTEEMNKRQHRETLVWAVQDNFDKALTNAREAFRRILSNKRDEPDLFQHYFESEARQLQKVIVQAANKDELHLELNHVVSMHVLLGSFEGKPQDILRAIHLFEDNDFFFEVYARKYFYEIYELVQNDKVKEVRRLLVYDNDDELKDPRSIRLMRFHSSKPHYSCKIIRRAEYKRLRYDARLKIPRDIGIYGNKYMYFGESNRLDSIVGYWVRDPSQIEEYTDFFDDCWNSPSATPPDASIIGKQTITLAELYEAQVMTEPVIQEPDETTGGERITGPVPSLGDSRPV